MDVTTKTSGGDGGDAGGDGGDGFGVQLPTPIDPAGEISDVGHCAHLPAPSSYVFGAHAVQNSSDEPLAEVGGKPGGHLHPQKRA